MWPFEADAVQREVLLGKIRECEEKPAGDEIKRLKNLRDFQAELESTGIKIPGFTTTKLKMKKFRADSPACERIGGWDNIKSKAYTGYKITSAILTDDCFISVEFKSFDDDVTMAVYHLEIHTAAFSGTLKDTTFPLIFRLLEMFTEMEHEYSHALDEKFRVEKARRFRVNSCETWIKSICEELTVPYQILNQSGCTLLCLVLNERIQASITIRHENFEKVLPELLSTIQACQNLPQKFKLDLSITKPEDEDIEDEDWDPNDDPDGAVEVFFRSHSAPPTVEKIIKAAEKAGGDGRVIGIYTKAINTIPGASGEPRLFFNRGIRYANMYHYDQAKKDFLESVRLKPSAGAYYNLGILCDRQKEYVEAREHLLQALNLDPAHEMAAATLAALDEETGYQKDGAGEEAAVPASPIPQAVPVPGSPLAPAPGNAAASELDNAADYYNRGIDYDDAGDFDHAIADYTQAIRLNPHLAVAYGNRGNAYFSKGDVDKAMADFAESLKLDPGNANVYTNRGLVCADQGDIDQAIMDFTEAIRLKPDNAYVYYNRGLAYDSKNDLDHAIADYTQSVKLDPDNAQSKQRLEFVQKIRDMERRNLEAARLPAPAGMALVPAGTFMMGSNDHIFNYPIHQVTISKPFYMGITEVTQKEWVGVTENNPSKCRGDNLPVEHLRWVDAVKYCNERSEQEGLTPVYSFVRKSPEVSRDPAAGIVVECDFNADGYRLPTEAEWEWAAKGGGKDTVVTRYSGSNNLEEVAWYADNSGGKTHPVGTKKANSLGIYDMIGNVHEWCWDAKDNYSGEPQIDPEGGGDDLMNFRIYRGGSCDNVDGVIYLTHRSFGSGWLGREKLTRKEFETAQLVGVRVCRNVPQ